MTPIDRFRNSQSELNAFLWTTELSYGLVKQRGLLKPYPEDMRAFEALKDIAAEAWFPNQKGSIKYFGTIGDMGAALDKNFLTIALTVAVFFNAAFDVFVEERFPKWVSATLEKNKGRPFLIPRPTKLPKELGACYPSLANLDPPTLLRADLTRQLRHIYVHKGEDAIPKSVSDEAVTQWKIYVGGIDFRYSDALLAEAVDDVIGNAERSVAKAHLHGKSIRQEFFYALFTFTNLRRLADELEALAP